MGKFIKNVMIFAAGLATGYAVSYRILNDRFTKEFDDYKAYYDAKCEEETDEIVDEEIERDIDEGAEKEEEKVEEPENKNSYKAVLNSCQYSPASEDYISYGKTKEPEKTDIQERMEKYDDGYQLPYVCEPDMSGFFEDSTVNYLTMYSDGVIVTDIRDDVPWSDDDIQKYLGGTENLRQMGKYEEDILHIYYPPDNTYYEITMVYEDYE